MGIQSTEKPQNKIVKSSKDLDSCVDLKIIQVAIIGCGAAGVATLFSLLESLPLGTNKNFKIVIFEKSSAFGPGLAYQCDSNELLMNMTSATTSIFPHQEADFWNWMLDKGYSMGGDQVTSRQGTGPSGYISRQFFGIYLKSRLEDAISSLERLGVEVELINLEVVDINILDANKFNIKVHGGHSRVFNGVILCTGNTSPNDIFNLIGTSQYINNPYPVNKYLKLINKMDSVGIIGGQLTAADIAVVLANQDHQGKINFFTRDSNFPLTRCQGKQYQLQYMTSDNLEILKNKNSKGISVRQILRLVRKDFFLAGIRWNKFFDNSNDEYCDWIRSLLEGQKDFSVWQQLAINSDMVIGDYWNALSYSEKDLFMSKFHRLWATKRVPLPTHTALKLYSLFRSGILKHYPYLEKIDTSNRNKFTIFVGNSPRSNSSAEVCCDWLINATGPSRDLGGDDESPLINNLLKSGVVIKNPHGGILLDYETSTVKTKAHLNLKHFYAIGHLTSGTYYFVSSLDMVSLKAKSVARHLVDSFELGHDCRNLANYAQHENMHAS